MMLNGETFAIPKGVWMHKTCKPTMKKCAEKKILVHSHWTLQDDASGHCQ